MLECLDFSLSEIIRYGIPAFFALSTRHFEVWAIELGFTSSYHQDLRRIARQYAEATLDSLGISIPLKKQEAYPSDHALLISWHNAFLQLEAIDYAEGVNNWVIKLKFEKDELGKNVDSTCWNYHLLSAWAKNPSAFPPLYLSKYLISEIRQEVMLQRILELEMRFTFPNTIEEIEADVWEEFLLKKQSTESWLKNQIHSRYQINKWSGIFRVLTNRQIKVLDKWGYEQVKNTHAEFDYFPLLELANSLQEKGYF